MKQSTRINRRLKQVKAKAESYKILMARKDYCEKNDHYFGQQDLINKIISDIHWFGFDYRTTKQLVKQYGEY